MALANMFTSQVSDQVIQRINKLTPETKGLWGKMSVAQTLAHNNVPYEMVYEDKHPVPNAFMKWMLRKLVKNGVVNEVPYPRNSRTAPAFIIKGERNFEEEKTRLIDYIRKTQQLGEDYFHNKVSHSFGALSKTEWNNMFYKHIDHHLTQFGV